MTDRKDRNERSPERRPAEGVRIIGAEEAQKALDAGQAAGRRADDELRFGDVPPAPTGPRPPHRFPLPDSVDPADAVPRPPVAPIRGESPLASRLHRTDEPARPDPAGSDEPAGVTEGGAGVQPPVLTGDPGVDAGVRTTTADDEWSGRADDPRWSDPAATSVSADGDRSQDAGAVRSGPRHFRSRDRSGRDSAPTYGADVASSGAAEVADHGSEEFEPTGPLPRVDAGGETPWTGPAQLRWAPDAVPIASPDVAPGAAAVAPSDVPYAGAVAPWAAGPEGAASGTDWADTGYETGAGAWIPSAEEIGTGAWDTADAGVSDWRGGADDAGAAERPGATAGATSATAHEGATGYEGAAGHEDAAGNENSQSAQHDENAVGHGVAAGHGSAADDGTVTQTAVDDGAGAHGAGDDVGAGDYDDDSGEVAAARPDADGGSDDLGTDPTTALPARDEAGARPSSSSWNLGERSSPWDDAPRADVEAPAYAAAGDGDPYASGAEWESSSPWAASAPPVASGDVSGPGTDPAAPGQDWGVAAAADVPDLALPEEGMMVTGSHVLPHWTEPSEGVPSSLLDPDRAEGDPDAAWNALGSGGARWRNEHDDWDDPAAGGGFFADEDDQGPRLGVLDTERSDQSDLYSFDEAFQQLEEERSGAHPVISPDDPEVAPEPEPVAVGARARARVGRGVGPAAVGRARTVTTDRARSVAGRGPASGRTAAGAVGSTSGQDLGSRVLVGAGLVVLLVVAYAIGPKALVVLTAVVVLFCAAEAYGILQRCGFRPATLLGLTATGGLVFAAYWRGEPAVPLVVALAFTATMIWYILGIVEARPLANVAVTSMTIVWVGVLGSFAALMLRLPHGKGLFLGAVVVTVASDIVAYFAGKQFGHRPLAPSISPGKTIEGFVAGAVAAIVVGIIIGKEVTPWGGIKHGLLLGVAVAIFAPIGDLFESLIKRDLEVKDSGTTLAGHGGLLDRFDSLLLVLPAVYYLADYLHLVR